jgi:hypothetical protein
MHFNLLLIHTSHFIVWQDYQNVFINLAGSSLEHNRERLATFIISEIISPNKEFHFKLQALSYMTLVLCIIVTLYIGFVVETMNTLCNI